MPTEDVFVEGQRLNSQDHTRSWWLKKVVENPDKAEVWELNPEDPQWLDQVTADHRFVKIWKSPEERLCAVGDQVKAVWPSTAHLGLGMSGLGTLYGICGTLWIHWTRHAREAGLSFHPPHAL